MTINSKAHNVINGIWYTFDDRRLYLFSHPVFLGKTPCIFPVRRPPGGTE